MNVWAVANQKGGVGKTTTAVTLAGHLAREGHSTLLVDLDPHGSMTAYFGYDPDAVETGVYDLFRDATLPAIEPLLVPAAHERLRLLPASTALATLDRQLGTQEGKGLVLAQALERLAGRFEYVLIDCPPVLGILMVNALAACERLLVPVQTEFLALKGLERILRTLEMIMRARRERLPYLIVPTMFDRRTRASVDSLRSLRERYDSELWDSVIPVDTRFREASARGQPLSLLHPQARGSLAYHALLNTLLGHGKVRHLNAVHSS